MGTFKKVFIVCATAALTATLCFTVFPSNAVAAERLDNSDKSLVKSGSRCVPSYGSSCYDASTGSIIFHYKVVFF